MIGVGSNIFLLDVIILGQTFANLFNNGIAGNLTQMVIKSSFHFRKKAGVSYHTS